jgi:Transposase
MIIIGVDYHPSVQQIAYVDTETGETCERRLNHSDGEAEHFYRALERRRVSVRVGIEATGHARWFERLLAELKFELWIGNAAEIKAARVRKQKTDRQDALLLLKLLVEDRFPRLWVPSPENRDLRQLIWHRHRLVQMRTRAMNQIQATAMNEGVRRKKALWSKSGRQQLESLLLAPWAARRRQDLLELVDRLNGTIAELTTAIEQGGKQTARGPAADDPSRYRTDYSTGLRAGHRVSVSSRVKTPAPTVSDWGPSPNKEVLCCAFYWWRQPRLLSAGTRLATPLRSSGHASRPPHRQGGDGTQASHQPLLDVEKGI